MQVWVSGDYSNWGDFAHQARRKSNDRGIFKRLAPAGSLLATNLQTVLGVTMQHVTNMPEVQDVLLYLHSGVDKRSLPRKAGGISCLCPSINRRIPWATGYGSSYGWWRVGPVPPDGTVLPDAGRVALIHDARTSAVQAGVREWAA
jgi:hypothetical protein